MKISNEVKFGIFTILTIVLFIVGMNYMKGSKMFGNTLVLYARYPNASGIIKGNPVMISGLKKGKVADLQLDMETSHVVATLEFDEKIDIPVDSRAIIYATDLLGSNAIRIELGDSLTFLKHDSRIVGDVETGLVSRLEKELGPVKDAITQLISQLDSTILWTNATLNEAATADQINSIVRNVDGSMANIYKLTAEVRDAVGSIEELATTANSIASNIEDNNGEIDKIINNFALASDSIASAASEIEGMLTEAESALANVKDITSKINSDNSTLGKLLNDKELYDNLNGSVQNVNELLSAIKANPQKYLDVDVYVFERKKKKEKE